MVELKSNHSNSLSKYNKLKLNLKKLLIDSTSHGLPKIFKSERVVYKIIWFLFFLCSISVGIYMSLNNVLEYFEREVVTKIEIINEPIMPFPTITIVNYDSLRQNFSLNETLLYCEFNFNELCLEKDFEITNNQYETIYQFNSNGSKISFKAGSVNSFTILFFPIGQGFQITIHNHTVDPDYIDGIAYSGLYLPIGFKTHIMIDKLVIQKLEHPYSNCYKDFSKMSGFDPLIYNHILKNTNYTYRQKDCYQYCLGKEAMTKCNITGKLDKFDTIRSKNKSGDDNCFFKTFEKNNKKLYEICSNYCPLECESNTFQISTTISVFPNYILNNYTSHPNIKSKFPENHNITLEDLRRTLVGFEVYYNDLKYTKITELPKVKLIELIANTGGILGLFVGISFLSFIEILEFILEIIFILIEKQ